MSGKGTVSYPSAYPAPPPSYEQAMYDEQMAQQRGIKCPQQVLPAPPPYYPAAPGAYGHVPVKQPKGTVVVPGLFNAGARFDGYASPSIPPPPPGCAPNAAQLAAMRGYTVIATKKKSDFWTGGAGGGTVFW